MPFIPVDEIGSPGDAPAAPPGTPRIGLALGCGGARGLAHVGVFSVLERAGLAPSAIAGTSMGAIVGALYAELPDADAVAAKLRDYTDDSQFRSSWEPFLPADGHESHAPLTELRRNVRKRFIELRTVTSAAQRSSEGLLGPIRRLFRARRFEDLSIPFRAVAADLRSGGLHVFDRGDLPHALYASSAVPGVFPPLELEGRLLVDGGCASPVPLDACRSMGPDVLVAVDIPTFRPDDDYRTGFDVILRTDAITRTHLTERILRGADLVVRPEVSGIHWADFTRMDRIREAGETAMRDALPELEGVLARRAAGGPLRG